MMDKIPVTPNMLHAQRTSTPSSVINGISTRTQKLIQKKEREGVHSALIQNRGQLPIFTPIINPNKSWKQNPKGCHQRRFWISFP